MRLKYFLRGLGTGIILTALILCISYRSGKSGESVVDQAKELGMVFPEGTRPPETVPEVSLPPATEEPEEKEKITSSGAGVMGTEAEESPKPDSSPSAEPGEKSRKNTFRVRDALLPSTVAEELKEAGFIKDDKAFDEYMEENGYSKKNRKGTYTIPKGASYRDIAKIITGQSED